MPDHLRTAVIAIRLPRWLILWMRDHEETQGHLAREALVEHFRLSPPGSLPRQHPPAIEDLHQLAQKYRRSLVSEYECLQEGITNAQGVITDPDDRAALEDIQRDIDAVDLVLRRCGLAASIQPN